MTTDTIKNIVYAVKLAVPFAQREPNRGIHRGIYFDKTNCIATDGRAMIIIKCETEESFILDEKMVEFVRKNALKLTNITFDNNYGLFINFHCDDIITAFANIVTDMITYKQVIPSKNDNVWYSWPLPDLTAYKKAKAFDDRIKKNKKKSYFILSVKNNKMSVIERSHDKGIISETSIGDNFSLNVPDINVNIGLLNKCNFVRQFLVKDGRSPILYQTDSLTVVIMPIKFND